MPEVRAESMEGGMNDIHIHNVTNLIVEKFLLDDRGVDRFGLTRVMIKTRDGQTVRISLYHEADIDLLPAKEEK